MEVKHGNRYLAGKKRIIKMTDEEYEQVKLLLRELRTIGVPRLEEYEHIGNTTILRDARKADTYEEFWIIVADTWNGFHWMANQCTREGKPFKEKALVRKPVCEIIEWNPFEQKGRKVGFTFGVMPLVR